MSEEVDIVLRTHLALSHGDDEVDFEYSEDYVWFAAYLQDELDDPYANQMDEHEKFLILKSADESFEAGGVEDLRDDCEDCQFLKRVAEKA